MANQYRMYQYTDSGAPVVNSTTAGSVVAALDAILVNGYGATPAAGWSKPFSSANSAVYRAPNGAMGYFQVQDTTTNPVAVLTAFETMSAFNTGTNSFPPIPGYVPKGSASTAPWIAFADNRTFMFFALGNNASNWGGCYAGEIYSMLSGDTFNMFVRGFVSAGTVDALATLSNTISSGTNQAWIARGYTGVGTAVNCAVTGDAAKGNSSGLLNGIIPFPDPVNGGLYLSPVWITDPTTAPANNVRGRMRGFWHCLHPNTSITNLQTFSGVGDLAGKTFIALRPAGSAGTSTYAIETSASLDTN